ncbi:class I SAM-dependent methyltransferase [Nitrospirillum amazonense]|uniref:Methyltransferase family protein n=1 Tax=Nitrospirillum amazonense TaxID=28077 RepID=A0A560JQ90_9PROT|nr:methyltransferase domain-containing protein [Nitrospirillum amazonense]MDG3442346.1 methyltransferase domain-containing protein [Nitrospirillum amazonense]TWB17342.1 methyltransferase family protein [Nitrospirillum amazonense]TWB21481.1 methyltransferase family protein [Nitrospirillum amazonense]TWB73156.1 methyltransferase family protein [Nitrospirillum amazonense]
MYNDVVDLREFYESSLGQVVRRLVRRRLRELWPDVSGQRVLGIGYATPFLRPFLTEAERVMAVMPAAQGVVFWPPEGPGLVTLGEESELPFPNMSVDRVLLVHGLEFTEHLKPMMQEIWRVLAGGGRLIAVVPNRRGIWARTDRTPFGHGSPFSTGQLRRVLRANLFVPERETSALFMPPVKSRFFMASAGAVENLGARWFKAFAGVQIVEASKQIYATTATRVVEPRRRLAPSVAQPAFSGLAAERRLLPRLAASSGVIVDPDTKP